MIEKLILIIMLGITSLVIFYLYKKYLKSEPEEVSFNANNYGRYTDDEIAIIKDLTIHPSVVAKKLGRTTIAIKNKRKMIKQKNKNGEL